MRAMKNSGVEWIGTIPSTWDCQKLKYYFRIKKTIAGKLGYDILSVTQQGIKIKDITNNEGQIAQDYSKYQLVNTGDFVMNHMDLLTGFVDCSKYSGVTSPDYRVFFNIDETRTDKGFYNYLFQSCYHNRIFYGLGQGVSGLGRWRLQTDKFLNFDIPVPSLYEQKKISNYLDQKCTAIDRIIEKQQEAIEKLKAYKQSIITEAVTKGLNPYVPMKDSGIEWIGMIPESWNVVPLTKQLTSIIDYRGKTPEKVDEGIFLVTSKNIKNGIINYELSQEYVNPKDYDEIMHRGKPHIGDLLFTTEAPLGEVANVDRENIALAQRIIKFSTKPDILNPYYLKYWIMSTCFQSFLQSLSTGSTAAGIKSSKLFMLPLVLPPLDNQYRIIDFLDTIYKKADECILLKEKLVLKMLEYKKSLIYEAVTGKLKIPMVSAIAQFPATVNCRNQRFAQAVLMSKVIDELDDKANGRVKLEKVLYTLENHIGFDFDTQYKRQVAGPFDDAIYECEGIISKKNKWFTLQGKGAVQYRPTQDKNKYKPYYEKYFNEYDTEILRIIAIFKPFNMDQAEIIATLYAAWNDAIIRGDDVTDEAIVDDVLNNWNESKKRFSKDVWLRAMQKMRGVDLIPRGYGKLTIRLDTL